MSSISNVIIQETKGNVTIELIASYVPGYDYTVIFEHTYANNEHTKIELVGWYFGEPNEDDTKHYANRDYICNL